MLVQAAGVPEEKEEANFSYNTNTALSWLHDMLPGSNVPHSRKKRYLGFPLGSNFEVMYID